MVSSRARPSASAKQAAAPVVERAIAFEREADRAGLGLAGGGSNQPAGLAALQLDAQAAGGEIEAGVEVERGRGLVGAAQRQLGLRCLAGVARAAGAFEAEGGGLPQHGLGYLDAVEMQPVELGHRERVRQLRRLRQAEGLGGWCLGCGWREMVDGDPARTGILDMHLASQQGRRRELHPGVVDLEPGTLLVAQREAADPHVEGEEAAQLLDLRLLLRRGQRIGDIAGDLVLGRARLGNGEGASKQTDGDHDHRQHRDADPAHDGPQRRLPQRY